MKPQDIKDFRARHKLTQPALAKHLNVTVDTVKAWESTEGSARHNKPVGYLWRALRDLERELAE